MMLKKKRTVVLAALLFSGVFAAPVFADLIVSASLGDLSAEAQFAISGTDLVITLTNTSMADVLNTAQLLTALFFDIEGSPTLGRGSAILAAGSTILYGSTATSGNATDPVIPGGVGGEWAYAEGLLGAPWDVAYGIGSAGFGLFGPGDLFPGIDLDHPTSPDGSNYGITSAGDNPGTGNGGLMDDPIIKNSVVFTLTGLQPDFELADIANVNFQYGTDLSDPNIPIPEPATVSLLAFGIVGLAIRRIRHRV